MNNAPQSQPLLSQANFPVSHDEYLDLSTAIDPCFESTRHPVPRPSTDPALRHKPDCPIVIYTHDERRPTTEELS